MLIATAFYRRLYIAGLIASEQGQSYSNALQFIWCKISFSLIDLASMCLRGPRSSFHATANEINFSAQRGPAGGLNLPQLADNLTNHLTDHPIIPFFLWVLCYNVHVFSCVCTVSQAVRMCAWLIITETGKKLFHTESANCPCGIR